MISYLRGLVVNLNDIFLIIRNYGGQGFYLVLYLIAFIYLFITEKNRKTRLLVIYAPLLIGLMILCPIYYRLYMGHLDDSGTYYRMLWLIPIIVTIAYAACLCIYKHRRVGAVIMCLVIIASGRLIYTSVDSVRAENPYHIPGYIVELCDHMEQDIKDVSVYACVPLEMLFYTRQYDSKINLLYGREAAEPTWGYYNEYFELFELAESLDWSKILPETRNTELGVGVVSYFVVAEDRVMEQDPTEYDLEEVYRTDGYVLYRDKVAVEEVREMLVGTPYMQ